MFFELADHFDGTVPHVFWISFVLDRQDFEDLNGLSIRNDQVVSFKNTVAKAGMTIDECVQILPLTLAKKLPVKVDKRAFLCYS